MSGEREIRDTADALNKLDLRHTEVLPLHARLSNSEAEPRLPAAQRTTHRAGDQRGGNLADRCRALNTLSIPVLRVSAVTAYRAPRCSACRSSQFPQASASQ
ncbi:hypothetical protein LN650_17925 [Klebsiella pneumoniae subsp. pneumoniae]|nr:hypothetical protein [Klebsiella pneumoniae subsp. pneumoniae]